jgi:hypothetical protein
MQLLTSGQFMLFLLVALSGGLARAVMGNYMQPFLDQYYNVEPVGYGIIVCSRVLPELAAFFSAKPLLKRFGPTWLLIGGLALGAVRISAYALLPAKPKSWAYASIGIETLKGLSSAMTMVGGTRIAHDFAPVGCEATAQGFFSGVHNNLANALAGLVSWMIIDWATTVGYENPLRVLFSVVAVVSVIAPTLFTLKYLTTKQ